MIALKKLSWERKVIAIILKVEREIFSERKEHNYFKCKYKSSGLCCDTAVFMSQGGWGLQCFIELLPLE